MRAHHQIIHDNGYLQALVDLNRLGEDTDQPQLVAAAIKLHRQHRQPTKEDEQ